MTETEKRIAQKIEVRADDSGAKTLTGYAAKFNTPTGIADYFVEQIAPGAFTDTIKGDVRCLFNHQSDNVLGRTVSGTLRLSEDAIGLRFEVDLPDTTLGRDVAKLVERGDINGMSFGFRAVKQTWDDTTDPPGRTLEKVEIGEISIVTFPAYPDTSVSLRSLEAARAEVGTRSAKHAALRASSEQKFRGIQSPCGDRQGAS